MRRTGIRERRYAAPGRACRELARAAGRAALADAGLDAAQLDLVLVATLQPDSIMPNAAPQVAHALGLESAAAFDIGTACTGFIAALACATALIESGRARNVLVIGAEIITRHVDSDDRNTAALFGDGAGAIVVSLDAAGAARPGRARQRRRRRRGDPPTRDTRLLEMDGHETFKQPCAAWASAPRGARSAPAWSSRTSTCSSTTRPTRASSPRSAERLELDARARVRLHRELGNTTAASVPLALGEARRRRGVLAPGMRVLLGAVGAGLTWGATVVKWGER